MPHDPMTAASLLELAERVEHEWDTGNRFGFPICKRCGAIRREGGPQKPCKGPVKVGLRARAQKEQKDG